MTLTMWALLAAVVILGLSVRTFMATAKARRNARRAPNEANSPDEAQAVNASAYDVALTCRVGGHAYVPFDTGWRCATCGNHVARREGELYGPAGEGRHERRRRDRD